jgi:hypothetical protein
LDSPTSTGSPDISRLADQLRAAITGHAEDMQFWTEFSNLRTCLVSTQASEVLSPAKIFVALRQDAGPHAGRTAVELLNAARLDLQELDPPRKSRFVGDGSLREKRLKERVAERLGQPFLTANYIPHLSARHRYLYMAVPKVACTTIKILLQQAELATKLDYFGHVGQSHDRRISPLLEPMDDFGTFMTAAEDPDWLRFTFVRNPFGRALSGYLNKIEPDHDKGPLLKSLGFDPGARPTFTEFLVAIGNQPDEQRDHHWASQSYLTAFDHIAFDFIGRLETLEPDLVRLGERLGMANALSPAEALNSTGASLRLSEYYTEREIELVRAIYADDFRNFGYSSALDNHH